MSEAEPATKRKPFWRPAALAILVALLNVGMWAYLERPVAVPDWRGDVGGFAFSAFQRYEDPTKGLFPSETELAGDIALLSKYTHRIRTYSSLESPQIPRLAQLYGMTVAQGAWLDRRLDHNDRELAALFALSRKYGNIKRAIVGNETILLGNLDVDQLIGYLDRARAHLDIPVSTAEPLDTWQRHPELARHVDFITVHILPYWENKPRKEAVDFVLGQYHALERMFPGKPVVIGEVGWPSNGNRRQYAQPSLQDEARFIREWMNAAAREHIDYYLMEAFDQPWKEANEGRAGAYWGVFDASRQPKFAFTGKVASDPGWPWKAGIASLIALWPMFRFARGFAWWRLQGRLFFLMLLQLAASILVWSATLPYDFYLDTVDWAMLALLLPAQLAIIAILLINGFEFTEVMWHRHWRRRFGLLDPVPGAVQPFVSIHLACCNEPPEMVNLTLDSLAALDYREFEVLVVDNNTHDTALWQPVEAHCRSLGARFRFFHLDPWPGFKAGALNFALEQTDPRAEVIAVVDADYAVEPHWLCRLAGYFGNPSVAVVQCPQAHREFAHNPFRRMTNWEYEGFFRIGMHHRNERNAIIQHGTMTLVRRSSLAAAGGWSEWTICEDAELGLRLLHAGHELVYVDAVLGRGLTPADFEAYKAQRYRWAFGAMQILKARWRWLTHRGSPLTDGQRFHFLTGWFSWFGDALHLLFTLFALAWTLGMVLAPKYFHLPMYLFLVPLIGFFVCKAVFGIVLYRQRVPCSWRDTLAASIASMALSHAIALGVIRGLVNRRGVFVRTAKSRRIGQRSNAFAVVSEEALLGIALVAGMVGMINSIGIHYTEGKLWIAILAAQAIPYFSAAASAWIAGRAGEQPG
ncbi:MAG: glycosyltransferase [Lysobacterales bacterium]